MALGSSLAKQSNKFQETGDHTRSEWTKRLEAQGFLCFYCGVPICENSLDPDCEATKDHLLAQSRGGVDFIWNIVAACARCNRLKGVMLPSEFLKRLYRFVQAVDGSEQVSTGASSIRGTVLLPLHKKRKYLPVENVEVEVVDHLTVSPACASAVRYLDQKLDLNRETDWYEKRRALLRQQASVMGRLSLEMAGQMVLPLFSQKQTGGMSARPSDEAQEALA
jgi:hypothetical protein